MRPDPCPGATEPSWGDLSGSPSDLVFESTDFDTSGSGGQMGFAGMSYQMWIDDVVVTTDRDANGSYETTEHIEAFTRDASGYADAEPTYDAAGNLTYDGTFAYTYDAWNRPRIHDHAVRVKGFDARQSCFFFAPDIRVVFLRSR